MDSTDKKLSRNNILNVNQNNNNNKIPYEKCIQKMLDENFPLKFMYLYSISYSILALIGFVFQILSIVYLTSYYYCGVG